MIGGGVHLELADKGGGRYLARLKSVHEAITVSDGSDIWKALPDSKRWSKVSAAAVSGDADEDDASADSGEHDLHSNLQRILLSHFPAVAKIAEDPLLVKEEDYKLGREKVRCYLIRAHARRSQFEWLVDAERFVVPQEKQKEARESGLAEATLKVKLIEWNGEVSDALFHFEPDRLGTRLRC